MSENGKHHVFGTIERQEDGSYRLELNTRAHALEGEDPATLDPIIYDVELTGYADFASYYGPVNWVVHFTNA